MIDSDNVLLLRPVVGLEFDRSRRAALGNTLEPPGLLAVTIWPLARVTAAEVPGLFTGVLKPALGTAGDQRVADARSVGAWTVDFSAPSAQWASGACGARERERDDAGVL